MTKMNVTAKYSNGAVHLGGHEMMNGHWSPACGVMHYNGGGREPKPLTPTDKPVTCKRCLKKVAAQAPATEPETAPEPEATAAYDHAAAVAQLRANIDAEEEERAAARRARNRTNYAPAPTVREAEPEPQEETEETPDVEAMREEYDDLVLIARGLRLLADELCRKVAEMKNSGMEDDHPRFKKANAKLVRTLDLESANLRTRVALADKIRETRVRNAYGVEKPFHRMVKDAIGLTW